MWPEARVWVRKPRISCYLVDSRTYIRRTRNKCRSFGQVQIRSDVQEAQIKAEMAKRRRKIGEDSCSQGTPRTVWSWL